MNPLEIPYILRIIFAFLKDRDRDSIFETCRIFRDNYLWVDPTLAVVKCMEFDNHKLAYEIFFCNRSYIKFSSKILTISCQKGFDKIIGHWLTHKRIKPNKCNKAIGIASENGSLSVVEKLLMDPRVNPSYRRNDAIIMASEYGHLDVVDRLLKDPRVDPSDLQNEAIGIASQNGHLSVVERLLKDPRVNPSDDDNFAIRAASRNDHLSVVERLLIDPRVDPSDYGNCALIDASRYGYLSVVERLLMDPRVDPSSFENNAIIWASSNGHLSVVERLLMDPRVDPSDNQNWAIRWAAQNGHLPVIERLLIDNRVNPANQPVNNHNICDQIIYITTRYGNLEVCKKLLRNPNIRLSLFDKTYHWSRLFYTTIKRKL